MWSKKIREKTPFHLEIKVLKGPPFSSVSLGTNLPLTLAHLVSSSGSLYIRRLPRSGTPGSTLLVLTTPRVPPGHEIKLAPERRSSAARLHPHIIRFFSSFGHGSAYINPLPRSPPCDYVCMQYPIPR